MQKEILEQHPSANVRVYVVWFSMIFSDNRASWRLTGHVITDPRVLHFWDEQKIVGRWFAKQENPEADDSYIVWDAYYLYGPDAEWGTGPEPLINRGATILDEFKLLEKNFIPLLTNETERGSGSD